ncbi:hypothetical protein C8R47DRAFT_726863 [Mycena vitilis]|nr:hypothetical protein C8R47DRAFT_726863 [Mycena vitilis]
MVPLPTSSIRTSQCRAMDHARPSDGSRDMTAALDEEEQKSFVQRVLDDHDVNKPDYQWIYDTFWSTQTEARPLLDDIVNEYCSEITPLLREFIAKQAPVQSWLPDKQTGNHEFLQGLNIPMLHDGPDMLLYGLGSFKEHPDQQTRVVQTFPERTDQHTVLLNTGGSGKTRLSLEGLCQRWGLYLTSSVDSQGHGSHDLENAIRDIENHDEFTPTLPSEDYEKLLKANRKIAKDRFEEVVYARLRIMETFCSLAKESGSGTVLEEHKKFWVLLQFRPQLGEILDIFEELSRKIRGAKRTAGLGLQTMALNAVGRIRHLVGTTGLFCVIDEAQDAAGKCLGAFMSSAPTLQKSPIFRGAVAALILIAGLWLIILGTGMSKSVVEETMASALIKGGSYRILHDVGGFDEEDAQAEYMKSLMPIDFKDTEGADDLCELAFYWLRGRFRFTAAFMRELLVAGFADPYLVLQRYIYASTAPSIRPDAPIASTTQGFMPTGGRLEALAHIAPNRVVKELRGFKFDRLKDHPALFETVKVLISQFCMRSDIAKWNITLTTSEYDAVEYGFARFADIVNPDGPPVVASQRPVRVVLDEPLVVLALERWLGEMDVSVHEGLSLRARLALHSASGSNGLEEYFAFYLSTVFDDHTPLTKIFRFDPEHIPDWAEKPAKLISLYRRPPSWNRDDGRDELRSGRVTRASRPSVSLGIGGDPEYVPLWLKHEIETPFLFPDNKMSPDIMFVLELGDKAHSRIWVAVQSKYSSEKLLAKSTLESALRSVTPQRFYLGKDVAKPTTQPERAAAESQQKAQDKILALLKALPRCLEEGAGTYSLLRVVAGWKAKIDLHRRGKGDQVPVTQTPGTTRERKQNPDYAPSQPAKSKSLEWYGTRH